MARIATPSPAKFPKAPKAPQPKTPPETRIQFGRVSAGIWPTTTTGSNGVKYPSWMVMVSRSYKTGDNYKRSYVFYPQDLLSAARALEQAYDYIAEQRQVEDVDEDVDEDIDEE